MTSEKGQVRKDDLLDLNDVLQHPGRRLEVDIETELEDEGELDLVRPLAGFLEAYSTGNLLIVKGEFATTAAAASGDGATNSLPTPMLATPRSPAWLSSA